MAQLKNTIITGSIKLGSGSSLLIPGYMWYNTAINKIQYSFCGSSWNVGPNINSISENNSAAGTADSGIIFNVYCTQPNGFNNNTEEFDGVTWASGGNQINARYGVPGVGTQNSALSIAGILFGNYCCDTEEYNGTSWTAGGNTITCLGYRAAAGSQNSALAFGGSMPISPISPYIQKACTEAYDGTSWSTGPNLSCAVYLAAGAGNQNAALSIAGYHYCDPSCFNRSAGSEEYNGISWSAGGTLSVARYGHSAGGTQNDAFAAGGESNDSQIWGDTELYDGTSWSRSPAYLNYPRYYTHAAPGPGSQNSSFVAGGYLQAQTKNNSVEIYNRGIVAYTLSY